ncbi:hypothetical protein OAL24_00186 [Oenococcus sicerae]|nr:hypothetical protein OAL24_00186 [Oenococcus sicerae]
MVTILLIILVNCTPAIFINAKAMSNKAITAERAKLLDKLGKKAPKIVAKPTAAVASAIILMAQVTTPTS